MKAPSQSSSILKRRSKAPSADTKSREVWTVLRALAELKRHGEKRNVDGMARFGIRAKKIYGVSKPAMDEIARNIGKNHALGLKLWETRIHDARILGMLISESEKVTAGQMERWVLDFDNWDVCDGTCCHLFVDAKLAWKKAFAWSRRKKEFEKRIPSRLLGSPGVTGVDATVAAWDDGQPGWMRFSRSCGRTETGWQGLSRPSFPA